MNNNDLLYEVTLDKDSKLIITTYAIKYSNCDFIHAVQVKPFVHSNYTKIFESKNLDNFVDIGYYDNPIIKTYGFTKKRKLAELYDTKTNAIKDDVVEQYGKDNFNSDICEKLETAIYKLVRFGIISGVIEAQQNAFKELCDMMVSSDCDDAADKVIKELSVEHKENFLDYYK